MPKLRIRLVTLDTLGEMAARLQMTCHHHLDWTTRLTTKGVEDVPAKADIYLTARGRGRVGVN